MLGCPVTSALDLQAKCCVLSPAQVKRFLRLLVYIDHTQRILGWVLGRRSFVTDSCTKCAWVMHEGKTNIRNTFTAASIYLRCMTTLKLAQQKQQQVYLFIVGFLISHILQKKKKKKKKQEETNYYQKLYTLFLYIYIKPGYCMIQNHCIAVRN